MQCQIYTLYLTLSTFYSFDSHDSRNIILKQLPWLPGNLFFNNILNIFLIRFDIVVSSLLPLYMVIGD